MKKDEIASIEEAWRRSVTFNFGGKSGPEAPEGFKDLGVGDEVTIAVSGTVTGMNADQHGSGMTLEVEEVEIVHPKSRRRTIGEMLREIKSRQG